MEQPTEEQWKKIEKNVNTAEKARVKAKTLKGEKEGFVLHNKDANNPILDSVRKKRMQLLGIPEFDLESVDVILEKEKEALKEETDKLLGDLYSPERTLVSLRWENLSKALKDERAIEIEQEKLYKIEVEILDHIDECQRVHRPTKSYSRKLDEVRKYLKTLDTVYDQLLHSTPEAYFGLHLKKIKEWRRDLEEGNFIETPSIKRIEEEVIETIRIGSYPFLHGHMGSGKTEFAKFISKKITGKTALVFSASKETTKGELIGRMALHRGEMLASDKLMELVDSEVKKYDEKNPDLSSEEKERKHQIISHYIIEREKTATESVFDFGYVYRAMRDGIPLIIDEYNMIPHSIWGRMNELLKKKPDDIIDVQEDGVEPFKVGKDFFFILTGNLNQGMEQYIDRTDLDTAGLRRIHPIRYDYMPQYYPKKKSDSNSLEENAGPHNELFQSIIAKMMLYGNVIELPKGTVIKVWKMLMGARVSQDIFAGRFVIDAYYATIPGKPTPQQYFLKKINIDLGRIDKIITAFLKNQDKGLDFYLWRYGISEAIDELDKAFLFQQFKLNFNFFEGWRSNEGDVLAGKARELVVQPAEKNENMTEKEFFTARELIEYMFGKAPVREKWPEVKETLEDSQDVNIEEFLKMEELNKEVEKYLMEIWHTEYPDELDKLEKIREDARLGQEA